MLTKQQQWWSTQTVCKCQSFSNIRFSHVYEQNQRLKSWCRKEKFCSCFSKNKGSKVMCEISHVLEGEDLVDSVKLTGKLLVDLEKGREKNCYWNLWYLCSVMKLWKIWFVLYNNTKAKGRQNHKWHILFLLHLYRCDIGLIGIMLLHATLYIFHYSPIN